MTNIEFVYFDLGNILVDFDPMIACRNVASLFGVTAEQANAAVYESGLEDQYEQGQLTDQELLSSVATLLGKSDERVSLQAFLDALGDMFQPIESMAATVSSVRAAGYRIGILSNTCFAHWDWVVRKKWSATQGPFEVTILSYEVGAMKPDERIYTAAEEAAGVAPEKLLFIDDKQENTDAAIRRGWNAGQCFGGDEAVEQFKRFGVLS